MRQPRTTDLAGRHRRPVFSWSAAVVVIVLWWAIQGSEVSPSALIAGRDGAGRLGAGFLRPDLSLEFLGDLAAAAAQTVQIAITGLAFAAVLGAPMALLMAGNVGAPAPIRAAVRTVSSILRGVPDLVWALLLVAAVGPGPAAGTLAIALHGTGLLTKLSAEQLEAVNPAPVEALRLAGTGRLTTALLSIVPQARAGLASLVLYQFECNIRTSAVLGFVGAGGLGQQLAISLRLFRYGEVSTSVGAVLVLMLAVDMFSRWARRRLGATTKTIC